MANTTTQFNIKINGKEELVTLDKLINQNAQSVGELKDQQDALNQAFEQAAIGTEAYDKLQSELRGVNTQLKVIDESVSDLTISEKFEGVGRIVGAVGGAFAFASVSVQAFGEENSRTAQELQKLETQISAIIQGQQALTGIIDAFGSKNKVVAATLNTLSKGFNAVGISAKGAGLAVRGALIATGIGALVAGVSFLVANFNEIKEAGAGIFKAWQPFFDGVRNFASALTFGLIDNATNAKIIDSLDAASQEIVKITEKTNAAIELSNAKLNAGIVTKTKALEDNLNNATTALDQSLVVQSNSFSNVVEQVVAGYNKFADAEGNVLIPFDIQLKVAQFNKLTKEVEKGGIAAEKAVKQQKQLTEEILKTGQDASAAYGNAVLSAEKYNFFLGEIAKTDAEVNKKSIERISALNQKRQEDQANAIAAANSQLKIQEINNQIANIELDKRKQNNDILKQAIDLIISYGNASKDILAGTRERFGFGELFVGASLNQLQTQIIKTLDTIQGNSPKLKQAIELLLSSIGNPVQKAVGNLQEVFVDIEQLYGALDILREREITNIEKENAAIQKSARERIAANNQIINNTTDQKLVNELKAQNKLIEAEANKSAFSIKKRIQDITITFDNLQNTIAIANEEFYNQKVSENFEKLSAALQKYKDGLQITGLELKDFVQSLGLSDEESNKLVKTFEDIDFTKPFSELSQAQKDLLDNNFIKLTIDFLERQIFSLLSLQKKFPELSKEIASYRKEIESLNKQLEINNKTSEDRIKILQEELALLIQAEQIRNLQAIADNPNTTNAAVAKRVEAIQKILAIEQKNIKDKFEAETKGLKETDSAYQIAIINRNKAEEELAKKTAEKITVISFERFKQITDGITETFGFLTNASSDFFGELTAQNNEQISLLQEAADLINEQISQTQEQISFLDELINERKSIIKELEAAAAEATGGQRQEILKQIDAEAEATRILVADKKKQKQAEADLQAQLAKNAAEQAKFAKENEENQKRAAVVNQIAAVSQAGIAVAKAFTPDPASTIAPFGIGLAVRTASAIALAASLFSLIGQVKRLFRAEGGFIGDGSAKKRADGGYTGPSTLSPDSTGERPMYHTVQLHEKEWVAPRWMTESSKYGSIINELEQTRVRGFADGGSITPLTTQSITNEQLTGLLVANLNKPIYVAVTDVNEGQSRVQVIENRARI